REDDIKFDYYLPVAAVKETLPRILGAQFGSSESCILPDTFVIAFASGIVRNCLPSHTHHERRGVGDVGCQDFPWSPGWLSFHPHRTWRRLRIQVQTNKIRGFVFELGIVASQVTPTYASWLNEVAGSPKSSARLLRAFLRFRISLRIGKLFPHKRAVLDGVLLCLDERGRPQFKDLLFHRGEPGFVAFDVLYDRGTDLRSEQVLNKKAATGVCLLGMWQGMEGGRAQVHGAPFHDFRRTATSNLVRASVSCSCGHENCGPS